MVQPVASRSALAASLVGDRASIAGLVSAARAAAAASTPWGEHAWAIGRLDQFGRDGKRFDDRDAVRMLVAVEAIEIREDLWGQMTRRNAASHVALWTDLTRRAPDEVRAAPAALLGFASWLGGDGAKAWCALDQVPDQESYPMARLMAAALTAGMSPDQWEAQRGRIRGITALAGDLAQSLRPPDGSAGPTAPGL